MPTFTHGKNATVLAGGYNLSPYFSSATTSGSADTAEVTTFGNASKVYIPGLKDATMSVEGFYAGGAGEVDDYLTDVLGDTSVWTILSQADALGARGYGAVTVGTTYEIGAEIGGAVSVSAEGQSTTGAEAVVVLHPLAARTATGTGTQVDGGAASTGGLSAYLHVTAKGSGTAIVAKVQHSADGSTWADLATFASVSAAGNAERITVSGTINRYIRAAWTLSGASPSFSFHLSAARL